MDVKELVELAIENFKDGWSDNVLIRTTEHAEPEKCARQPDNYSVLTSALPIKECQERQPRNGYIELVYHPPVKKVSNLKDAWVTPEQVLALARRDNICWDQKKIATRLLDMNWPEKVPVREILLAWAADEGSLQHWAWLLRILAKASVNDDANDGLCELKVDEWLDRTSLTAEDFGFETL